MYIAESELRAVLGHKVKAWLGVEMALREVVPSGFPMFHDSTVPCLQFLVLVADLGPAGLLRFQRRSGTPIGPSALRERRSSVYPASTRVSSDKESLAKFRLAV